MEENLFGGNGTMVGNARTWILGKSGTDEL